MDLKNVHRGRIKEYADKFKGVVYTPIDPKLDYNPLWNHTAHCAFPSATQNEINAKDAQNLVKNGVYVVSELSLIHISEPTRLGMISYAVFCLKKKKRTHK